MSTLDLAREYFDAWNRREPDAIVSVLADGGTYEDPATGGPLSGDALAGYTRRLFDSIPDLEFEIATIERTAEARVAAQWLMTGTNSGPFAGAPPSGNRVSLPGADFISLDDAGVHKVVGYFDRQAFAEQLGLQVLVQPPESGAAKLGEGMWIDTGRPELPAALAVTWIEARTGEEKATIDALADQVVSELLQEPDFLSFGSIAAGGRLYTITSWASRESVGSVLRTESHKAALGRVFRRNGLGGSVMTSVWVPSRVDGTLARCTRCGAVSRLTGASATCRCGQALLAPTPFV